MTLIASLFALCAHAQQWDGAVTGKVTNIDVTSAENYGFRVYLEGKTMCNSGPSWAYLNASDGNYKAYVALFMLARSMDKQMLVYTTKEQSGYCKIGYASMQP
ncbi:hypothetical protein [Roseateles chitinivorans]|uniref:hypothetical protein n=1 Tax=Roseateles chitinivorans TaxID=2917965 RepID=UPI003D672C95